jgi:hypothetical protein
MLVEAFSISREPGTGDNFRPDWVEVPPILAGASMRVSLIIGRRQQYLKISLLSRYRGKMARVSMV